MYVGRGRGEFLRSCVGLTLHTEFLPQGEAVCLLLFLLVLHTWGKWKDTGRPPGWVAYWADSPLAVCWAGALS